LGLTTAGLLNESDQKHKREEQEDPVTELHDLKSGLLDQSPDLACPIAPVVVEGDIVGAPKASEGRNIDHEDPSRTERTGRFAHGGRVVGYVLDHIEGHDR
jgi:hypothetical protein